MCSHPKLRIGVFLLPYNETFVTTDGAGPLLWVRHVALLCFYGSLEKTNQNLTL